MDECRSLARGNLPGLSVVLLAPKESDERESHGGEHNRGSEADAGGTEPQNPIHESPHRCVDEREDLVEDKHGDRDRRDEQQPLKKVSHQSFHGGPSSWPVSISLGPSRKITGDRTARPVPTADPEPLMTLTGALVRSRNVISIRRIRSPQEQIPEQESCPVDRAER